MDFTSLESFSGGSSKTTSSTFFPVVNGKVTVEIGEKEVTFNVYSDLSICDALELSNGSKVHILCGQSQEYLVTHIFKKVMTKELADSRAATLKYLWQIQQAVEAGELWVQTIFGLKFLSWRKSKTVDPQFETEEEFLF